MQTSVSVLLIPSILRMLFTTTESALETCSDSILSIMSNGPVTALMSYIWLPDPNEPQGGNIWITSTTNRHKFQAWKRNPQISICIWPVDTTQQQVTLRGRVELFNDPEIKHRWIQAFVHRPQNSHLTEEQIDREYTTFDSPNRWFIKVHIDRWRTYDGFKMRQAENEGIDVWGEDFDFPQGH